MWADGGGSGSCDDGGMRVSGGFLFLRPLFAKLAFRWLVDGPCHVVDAPVKGILAMLLGLWVALLGRDLLPRLVLSLLSFVGLCHRPWLIGGKTPSRQRSRFANSPIADVSWRTPARPPKYSDLLQ